MRTDGQTAIDAISAENAALKAQLDQTARASAAAAAPPPAYGPGVAPGTAPNPGRTPASGPLPEEGKVSLMSFETGAAGPKKPADRTGGGSGTGGSVRFELGGRGSLKKKNKTT